MNNLILIPNPIPPENHGKNLRSMLPTDDWDILRTDCYMRSKYVCEICGGKGKEHPVEAHEEWEFNTKDRIQRLVKISALCPDCHLVKHIGRAEHIGKFDKAFKHFCRVNKLRQQDGEHILTDLLNEQFQLMSTSFRIDIEVAKVRLLELMDDKETVLQAFPIIQKKGKSVNVSRTRK